MHPIPMGRFSRWLLCTSEVCKDKLFFLYCPMEIKKSEREMCVAALLFPFTGLASQPFSVRLLCLSFRKRAVLSEKQSLLFNVSVVSREIRELLKKKSGFSS